MNNPRVWQDLWFSASRPGRAEADCHWFAGPTPGTFREFPSFNAVLLRHCAARLSDTPPAGRRGYSRMTVTIALLAIAAVLIYGACEFFVNGVEWVGRNTGVAENAVGLIFLS